MKKPKAINLFLDMREEFSELSEEQVGRLVMAVLAYAQDGDEPDFGNDQTVKVLYRTLKKQVDRDFAKYDETCKRRTVAAKIAAGARYHKNYLDCESHTNASDRCQYEDEDKYEDKYEDKNENDDDDEYENKNDSAAAEDERASSLRDLMQSTEILLYLSKQAHTEPLLTDQRAKELVIGRLHEGYRVEELKQLIDRRCHEWLGTQYAALLRPDFLFGEGFEGYLNG